MLAFDPERFAQAADRISKRAIRHADDIYLHPEKLYSKIEFEEKQKELNRARCKTVGKYGHALYPKIRNALDELITAH